MQLKILWYNFIFLPYAFAEIVDLYLGKKRFRDFQILFQQFHKYTEIS